MKRIILLLLSIIIGCNLYAQKHMTFKGVEINGKPSHMARKLEKVGFTQLKTKYGEPLKMVGEFAGYPANVFILSNSQGQTHSILAVYQDIELWDQLLIRFELLEEILIEKYGEPLESTKDAINLSSISLDKGEWESMWSTDKGGIMLFISATSPRFGTLSIGYQDSLNNDLQIQQAYEDL